MTRQFKRDDTVSFVKDGTAVLCEVDGYATNGMVSLITKEKGKMVSLWEKDLTLVESAPEKSATKNFKKGKRWTCLDCGAKHSAHQCPVCGSDEYAHNTDGDTDASILAEPGRSEKYYPGE
jgi:RNA polymerase subunit RPABC4/transcription elongation factor Spt4